LASSIIIEEILYVSNGDENIYVSVKYAGDRESYYIINIYRLDLNTKKTGRYIVKKKIINNNFHLANKTEIAILELVRASLDDIS